MLWLTINNIIKIKRDKAHKPSWFGLLKNKMTRASSTLIPLILKTYNWTPREKNIANIVVEINLGWFTICEIKTKEDKQ